MADHIDETDGLPRAIFDASRDAIFIETIEGKILDCNGVAFELFGYTRDEMLRLEVTDLVPPEVAPGLDELVEELKRGGSFFAESFGRRKDGTVFPAEASARTVTLGDEQRVAVFVRDVTERKRTEKALRISEDRYRTVVENSTEIITIVQGGIIKFINSRGAELTGMTVDDIVGRPLTIVVAEEDREMVVRQHHKRLAGETLQPYAFRFKDAAGQLKWLETTGALVEWKGRPATVNFLTDITDRKRLEEQLRHAQRMEAVGRLAGGVSHDFNNLLTAINGYGSLLLNHIKEGAPGRREVEGILRAGKRGAELTDQLLVFSRRKVVEPQVVDLNRLIAGMENMLHRLINQNVALETVLDPGLEAITVDPGQMEQVVMNLVVNAHEAMPDGGQITVRTENVVLDDDQCLHRSAARPGRFVRLTVVDDGPGLAPEVLDHIFEPFFTTREKGTGLGLSLVYGIITQHAGWVEVSSRSGKETIFSIFLPRFSVIRTDEPQAEFSHQGLEGLQGSGERILLVEDDEGVRSYATHVLEESGYRIFAAANADEALKLFTDEGGNFRLVFSDQVLPGRSGLELVEELRLLKPGIEVVLTSGYTGKAAARKQIEGMAYPFLRKPYSIYELLTTIHNLLANPGDSPH